MVKPREFYGLFSLMKSIRYAGMQVNEGKGGPTQGQEQILIINKTSAHQSTAARPRCPPPCPGWTPGAGRPPSMILTRTLSAPTWAMAPTGCPWRAASPPAPSSPLQGCPASPSSPPARSRIRLSSESLSSPPPAGPTRCLTARPRPPLCAGRLGASGAGIAGALRAPRPPLCAGRIGASGAGILCAGRLGASGAGIAAALAREEAREALANCLAWEAFVFCPSRAAPLRRGLGAIAKMNDTGSCIGQK